MIVEESSAAARQQRAAVHRALGDADRLRLVDALWLSDHTPTELARLAGMPSNLLAFHLDVLTAAGLIERQRSRGDRRRRYVRLRVEGLAPLSTGLLAAALAASVGERRAGRAGPDPAGRLGDGGATRVLFVCTANAARSPLAAALWTARTQRPAWSAGTAPADQVHPLAARVARRHGLHLTGTSPVGYDAVPVQPTLVVSVCDRAHESPLPFAAPVLHWSVPDPAGGRLQAFEEAYASLRTRVWRLAEQVAA